MTSILMHKPPEQVANILSGKQSIIISKTAPKDWKDFLSDKTEIRPEPITGYVYCAKNGIIIEKDCGLGFPEPINGKVVAKVIISSVTRMCLEQPYLDVYAKRACVSADDVLYYQMHPIASKLYAYHISDLQIFDEPMELNRFYHSFRRKRKEGTTVLFDYDCEALRQSTKFGYEYVYPLNRAPRSWCYVEEPQ